uniref:FMRFamide receptor n=1 Tax=Gongylonema pulchrum TaxID=637853 RepID=A0A183DF90_9BILA
LVAVDADKLNRESSPKLLYKVVRSTAFQSCMMVMIILNAIINASLVYRHDASDEARKRIYYYVEVN